MLNIKDLSGTELPSQENYEQALQIGLEIFARKDPGRVAVKSGARIEGSSLFVPHLDREIELNVDRQRFSIRETGDEVAVWLAILVIHYLNNADGRHPTGRLKHFRETIRNAVNAPAVAGEALERLKPYLDLAQRLGLFVGQMVQTGIKSVEAQYSGEVADMELKPITTSFLTGLLTPIMQDDVNLVNAPFVAQERGISVSETRLSRGQDFISLLRFNVVTERTGHLVEGTLFGKSEPRMVRYGAFRGEFDLSGNLILIQGIDQPGVIGKVGTTLGQRGVNISHFSFARIAAGGEALLFLNTDSPADDLALEDLRKLDHIKKVRRLVM